MNSAVPLLPVVFRSFFASAPVSLNLRSETSSTTKADVRSHEQPFISSQLLFFLFSLSEAGRQHSQGHTEETSSGSRTRKRVLQTAFPGHGPLLFEWFAKTRPVFLKSFFSRFPHCCAFPVRLQRRFFSRDPLRRR